MGIEKTLTLMKPDLLAQGPIVCSNVLNMWLRLDLTLVETKSFVMSCEMFIDFYSEHKEKVFFRELLECYRDKAFTAFVFQGENAIAEIRRMNGHTDPYQAEAGTIRYLYGTGCKKATNAVHASDSGVSFLREYPIIW